MKGAREGVRMKRYLPKWATLAEAERWLLEATGEEWPLPRLIENGLRVFAWAGVRPHEDPKVIRVVYGGRPEGFLSEFVFGGDLQRMAIDRRSIVITITRSPDGLPVRFDPPCPVEVEDLRFAADEIRSLAAVAKGESPLAIKRGELIRRLEHRWPAVRADMSEASRNGLAAAAKVDGKGWLESAALAWAKERGRLREPVDAASPFPSRVVRRR